MTQAYKGDYSGFNDNVGYLTIVDHTEKYLN
jgi:hypothetical protein